MGNDLGNQPLLIYNGYDPSWAPLGNNHYNPCWSTINWAILMGNCYWATPVMNHRWATCNGNGHPNWAPVIVIIDLDCTGQPNWYWANMMGSHN